MSHGKRTSSCAVLLLLCTVLVLSGATNETKKNSSTCALQFEVLRRKTETKCKLMAEPLRLNCSREVYSSILRNVSSLDLFNKLTQVPTWIFPFCKSLTELSLSRNNIKEIKPNTFKYLENLKTLNLSFNDLREWRVDPNTELQSLNYLDVTDNEHWLPSEQLLQLKNLTTVRGLTLTKYCNNCSLMKPHVNADEDNSSSELMCRRYDWMGSPSGWKWSDQIQYGKALDFIKLGFWTTCLCDDACYIDQYVLPFITSAGEVMIKSLSSLYATGSVAMLVNITVVLVIAFHKSLRGDLAIWLILNVAVCDVLIGLSSVMVARYDPVRMYIDFLYDELEGNHYNVNSKLKKHINILGPMLTCAVVSEVGGSFILTLERFLKIVFAMKPVFRIGKRGVILYLFISWSLSVTYALLPFFNVGHMTYSNGPFLTDEGKAPVGIAFVAQIVGVIIQLTSCVLYVPIFIVAKGSAANVGIKRDAAIAKKMALLVFTNLIFFVVPAVIWVFRDELWKFEDEKTLTQYQWIGFAIGGWLSLCCVTINSILNPFLYAVRHPKIKQQLHAISTRFRTVLSERFVALGQHLPFQSNAVQQRNDTEMQEVN